MENRIRLSGKFLVISVILVLIGVAALVYGFITDPQRTWANYLLTAFYFFLLSVGATFFLALQSITRSGWSSGFRRVPEAMMMYLPVAGLLMIVLYFGLQYLYPWTQHAGGADEVVQHQSPYMNVPFFFIRLVAFFAIWTLLAYLIRRASLREDLNAGSGTLRKMEKYSAIFIFFLAISFSLLGFDLIMSTQAHWFSTIFSLKYFIAAFQHGTALIFILIVLMNLKGHFGFLNVYHVHDFARYIFIVSIFYGYFWFSQFMLIWYSNIPEETFYYYVRWAPEWKSVWILDILLNWAIPFFVLLPVATSRQKWIVFVIAVTVLIGQWVDLYITLYPAAVGKSSVGFIEAGSFLGFAGLFALITGYHLSKASLVPENNPFIQESYEHHFESYI
ncbi:MAG TPA: hypothetical protein VK179_08885 [Bacteroidales bacterium]|nr:hypothetical protein [Bacteroidales bacterium]